MPEAGDGQPRRQGGDAALAPGLSSGFVLVAGPFLVIMALGAMLPTIDFDALEYHLQGPKEYYQAGRIAFLPHNVYTSMPFGVEMLHLLGMEVLDDWWRGALVGQFLVAIYAPAAAAMVALAAARAGLAPGGLVRGGRLPDDALGLPAGGPALRRGAALFYHAAPSSGGRRARCTPSSRAALGVVGACSPAGRWRASTRPDLGGDPVRAPGGVDAVAAGPSWPSRWAGRS